MTGILDGIRIIDWTHWHFGPAGAAYLADMGAEVIHVEEAGVGDGLRGLRTFFGRSTEIKGRNIGFEEINRNKKGIALKLDTPAGMEVMHRLIKTSHVFLTTIRPKARVKLGLDYENVRKLNPDIIYVSGSTFGPKGPDKDLPGLEVAAYARSGMMWGSGEEGMPPIQPTAGMGDRMGSIYFAYATVCAILAKERHGIAQEVNVSLLGSMIDLQRWAIQSTLLFGNDYPRQLRAAAKNPIYNYYKCKDGQWIALGLLQSDRHWSNFCKAIDRPELENAPKFKDAKAREENCETLIGILDKALAVRTYDEWESRFKKVDFLFAKINRFVDLPSDPQVQANNYVMDWEHPVVGHLKTVGFPIDYSRTPCTLRMPGPEVGQHTEEVLLDVCGYTWEEISSLRGKGAF